MLRHNSNKPKVCYSHEKMSKYPVESASPTEKYPSMPSKKPHVPKG